MRYWLAVLFILCRYGYSPLTAYSQNVFKEAGAAPATSSNIFNPNVSVIGWFQGQAGRASIAEDESPAFRLREAEIGFQSVVDPYSRADIFVSVNDEGSVDLEEGYLTFLALPLGFQAKLGKFQPDLGKFNRTHTPETNFADRPLAARAFFGGEPLKGVGGALSHIVPNPWETYINLDAEAVNTPDSSEAPAFGKANNGDLLYVGRLSVYRDLSDSTNLTLGFSYANGANGFEINQVNGSSTTRRNHVAAVDLTFRWKNPRRAIYRSLLWQTEFYWTSRNLAPEPNRRRGGAFSAADYQFARRWHAGIRGDWVQRLEADDASDTGGLIYLTFTPSEFSLVSLQGKHVKFFEGTSEDMVYLKVTFNIGPHGAHPF
jgi:hypothetical protein